jgi:hypothetical protein
MSFVYIVSERGNESGMIQNLPIRDPIKEINEALKQGNCLQQRKNFADAIPHFRNAFCASWHTARKDLELSCLNRLISCLRMTGVSGCSEAERLIGRTMELITLLSNTCSELCMNGYINVGSLQILKKDWNEAISIFRSAEGLLKRYRDTGVTVKPGLEAMLLQCTAQAHMGLFSSNACKNKGLDQEAMRLEILSRLSRVVRMDEVPKDLLAAAHRCLAYYHERIASPADPACMERHRREMMRLLRTSSCGAQQCAICTEEINLQDSGIATLGCFHMFHR